MNIRVINSAKPSYWYAKKIGEVFDGEIDVAFQDRKYRVKDCRDGTITVGYVDVGDCEVVTEVTPVTAESKITVLTDEYGLQREYTEVSRKAAVGERIKCMHKCSQDGRFYRKGDVGTMRYLSDKYPSIRVKFAEGHGGPDADGECYVGNDSYVVLEPSNVVIVDGERYNVVERKANVGERVVVVALDNAIDYAIGDTYEVRNLVSDRGGVLIRDRVGQPNLLRINEYRVLEPIKTPSRDIDGRKATVTDGGLAYTTYSEFAGKYGYPEAVKRGRSGLRNGDTVTLLTSGPHLTGYRGNTLWIVEKDDGERYIINGDGLSIDETPVTLSSDSLTAYLDGLTDTVAKLTLRVTELERQNRPVTIDMTIGRPAPAKTLTRDAIVELAKKDVADLERTPRDVLGRHPHFWPKVNDKRTSWIPIQEVEYVVNREKMTVVALIRSLPIFGGDVFSSGKAVCDPDDCFNVHIGKAIALRRALKLDVPAEYVKAPQPTEPRVGDVVLYTQRPHGKTFVTTLTERTPRFDGGSYGNYAFYHTAVSGWIADNQYRVIDDSRDSDGGRQ